MNATIFNNATLRLARDYFGLSQTAFGKKINTKQSIISNIENGERPLEIEQIQNLSDQFTAKFFKSEINLPSQKLFYRKLASTSKSLVSAFEARLTLISMTVASLLDIIDIPESKIPTIDLEDHSFNFEYLASEIRLKFGVLRGPIEDIVTLLEKNGVIIHFFDFDFISSDNRNFDGVSTYVNGVPLILINNKIPNSRKVFTIAHELAHLIFHFDFIIPESRNKEKEADAFASAFLAPRAEVQSVFKRLNKEKLFSLKKVWRMSAAAILYRTKDIGNITQDWYNKCIFWLSPYRKLEPFEFEISHPTLLRKVIKLAQDETDFSFLKEMGFKENVVEELFSTIIPKKNNILRKLSIEL
ncbi:XRE family transcriptional regulator [Chryseobacterium arthrosphaerae]|uniref:XRE family transcriptional regulator n=1 Tax=Chryseobacterium arthrosphaerae TaxID=651561 RepID=UPI001E3D1253|nr:XRE family transcriptional regulator [Chryseobacterium arthrosphaerae]UEQ75253.1 ImmA/IrrE family metallo-endopeptidase [Chryseobacterium arthrosphaerae]